LLGLWLLFIGHAAEPMVDLYNFSSGASSWDDSAGLPIKQPPLKVRRTYPVKTSRVAQPVCDVKVKQAIRKAATLEWKPNSLSEVCVGL
jgi:hypothetical protein